MEVKGPQSGYNFYFEQQIWLLQKNIIFQSIHHTQGVVYRNNTVMLIALRVNFVNFVNAQPAAMHEAAGLHKYISRSERRD